MGNSKGAGQSPATTCTGDLVAQWTDATGRTVRVPTTGNSEADRRAMIAALPDLLADLRQTGSFARMIAEMRERQERIERQ